MKKWQRQHQVLTLNPKKNMQLQLLFPRQHGPHNEIVAVGVEDLQLFPVLSEKPRVAQTSVLFPDCGLCASIRAPSIQELTTLGLAHLFRGNQSIEQDNWERLHVTIAISAKAEAVECQFTAPLFYTSDVEVADV